MTEVARQFIGEVGGVLIEGFTQTGLRKECRRVERFESRARLLRSRDFGGERRFKFQRAIEG